MTRSGLRCVWTRRVSNWWLKRAHPCRPHRGDQPASTTSTSGAAYVPCSWCASRWPAGARLSVSDHRGMVDFAHVIKHLVDDVYPHAVQIPLVMDNLNTHSPGSLYEAFEPAEAKRLADKLEIHYTPKHGSWLNMAEIELSVLNGQCLDRRIADG